ncbi:MAG: hypothetical protein QOD83_2212 [Solirubrobacteraceae bacterium]|jgi:hypothetical protein|nr:hypothetical protein [Solirubrobacteraceae bacterium]
MSTTTSDARLVAGAIASGRASVLWSLPPAALVAGERQILMRVDPGGVLIGEGELRYQLERKDDHPLARRPDLLDLVAELEDRGLVEREVCFRLTAGGRTRLAELISHGGEG